MRRLLLTWLALLAFPAWAGDWEEHSRVGELFREAGLEGTFVVLDVGADRYIGHNRQRAETRYIPASTFKIANALIGLSSGVVASVDEKLPYLGPPNPFMAAWARDMGLREAMPLSNVPIFQELARRTGLERMRQALEILGYGNAAIGDKVDEFWLHGPLMISAVEQASFLAHLAGGSLPLPADAQQDVHDITLLERGENWELHGKTGWQNAPGPGVGWWVGWVRQDQRIYAFALNLDIREPADARQRVDLGKASLRALGLLR
jgi:beta-lactamase class D